MFQTLETGVSLGSNLGNRLEHLQQARDALAALPGVALEAQSPIYETEPVDVQPAYRHLAFLNAVLILSGRHTPEEWLAEINRIEDRLGRRRGADRNAPRVIDIDLLFAGDTVRNEPDLTLPHPRWMSRSFVVRPLADVRPGLRLPGCDGPVSGLADALPDRGQVRLFAADW